MSTCNTATDTPASFPCSSAVSSLHEKPDVMFPGEEANVMSTFLKLSKNEQVSAVKHLIEIMDFTQLQKIYAYLVPKINQDFLSMLSDRCNHIILAIFTYLDYESLAAAEKVCHKWLHIIKSNRIWEIFLKNKTTTDPLWHLIINNKKTLKEKIESCFSNESTTDDDKCVSCQQISSEIFHDVVALQRNWITGLYRTSKVRSPDLNTPIYCLQYDEDKVISGCKSGLIKIWDISNGILTNELQGHLNSVLCLQYDHQCLISGSSDNTVRVWCLEKLTTIKILTDHITSVMGLMFKNQTLITCSKDRLIFVYKMESYTNISKMCTLVGHMGSVNKIDFDEKYIVSAGGDKVILVWDASTYNIIHKLEGHSGGVACLSYHHELIISGSSDLTIRIWRPSDGVCISILKGHCGLIRTLSFNDKYIVSGDYNGVIKIWDLCAVLSPRSNQTVCLHTLQEKFGACLILKFDALKIVSGSYEGDIIIRNFL